MHIYSKKHNPILLVVLFTNNVHLFSINQFSQPRNAGWKDAEVESANEEEAKVGKMPPFSHRLLLEEVLFNMKMECVVDTGQYKEWQR
jgi:hypothetical protein